MEGLIFGILQYFNQKEHQTRNCHPLKFINVGCRTNISKYSFFPRSVKEWNELPETIIIEAANTGAFKLACVASVSVWFRSKEIPRKGTFGFDRARNERRVKKWKRGEGKGKEGNACRQTPRFWKPAFASERSAWLARLVEQYWHVSIKGLFHTERSCMVRDTRINFLCLLFILVGKICPPMQEHFL